jgi:low temperature requirement protein LtrA
VWFIWVGYTIYNERFESAGLENRLFTFVLMIPVIFLAVFGQDHLEESFVGYAVSYAAAKTVIILLWLRASWHVPAFRPVGYRYAGGFAVAVALALLATGLEGSVRYAVFGLAVLIDVATPFTTVQQQAALPRFSTSKLPERYGLFVIIVLGETVVALVGGLADQSPVTAGLAVEAVLGVAFVFAVWWLYFDFVARRPPRRAARSAIAWGYLHLPLVMAVVAAGAGIENVLVSEGVLSVEVRAIVAAATGVLLVAMGVLELTLERAVDEPTHLRLSSWIKYGVGAIAALVAVLPISSPTVLLVVLLALMAVPAAYGVWVWFLHPAADPPVASPNV